MAARSGISGFEVVGEAGAPVWHQLTTRDYGRALDFYREVFGWQTQTVSDTDEFRYSHCGVRRASSCSV